MPRPGRNDPCPCGSGQKYKRCCAAAPARVGITDDDREIAWSALIKFSLQRRFSEHLVEAEELFWRDFLPYERDDAAWLDTLFLEWAIFDFETPSQGSIAHAFLTDRGGDVTAGGREWIARCAAAPIQALQSVGAGPEGVAARQLLDPEATLAVRDDVADAARAVPHEILIVRLTENGDGSYRTEGTVASLPPLEKPALQRALRRTRYLVADAGEHAPPGMMKMALGLAAARALVHWVLIGDGVDRMADGEPIRSTAITMNVHDRARVADALARDPSFEAIADLPGLEGQAYNWCEGVAPERHVRALLIDRGDNLELQAFTPERADSAYAELAAMLGDAVSFQSRQEEDLDAVSDGIEAPAPPEGADEAAFYDAYYRAWIDQPAPSLNGRTPRAAAGVRHLQPMLTTLVEGVENETFRLARYGWTIDVAWLRRELNLPPFDLWTPPANLPDS